MSIYVGLELDKKNEQIYVSGINETPEKALKLAILPTKKAFLISHIFREELILWLAEETNMVGAELKDSVDGIIEGLKRLSNEA